MLNVDVVFDVTPGGGLLTIVDNHDLFLSSRCAEYTLPAAIHSEEGI